MLQRLFSTLFLIFCLFAANLSSAQTVPRQMSYQGKLNDANGIPFSGTISIQFVITATDAGGVLQQWSQTQSLAIVNGLYSATLGATGNFIPTEIFTKNNPTLSIFINGTELLPSISLLSVPYSFYAEHVGTLDDNMVESNHILNGTIKLEDLEADIANQNTLLYMTPAGNLRWRDADEFVTTVQGNTLQESTVANNGLTLTGTAVRLGGTLTQATTIDLASSALTFTSTTGNIVFSPSGDFSLPLGTAVNNIVTVLSSPTDRQIPTAKAVLDAITSGISAPTSATNGVSIFGVNEVGLGGTLVTSTTITTQSSNDLLINGGGNFNVDTDLVAINGVAGLDITANNDANFTTTSGTLTISQEGMSGDEGDIEIKSNRDITIDATGVNIDASNLNIAGTTDVNIEAANNVNIEAANEINIDAVNDVNIDASNIDISAINGTKISIGTFALEFGAEVNDIATVLQLGTNDDDNTLLTAKAIADAINTNSSIPDNGLTYVNGSNIGLGGDLTIPSTIINTSGTTLTINDGLGTTGRFEVGVNTIELQSENNLTLISNSTDIFMKTSANRNISLNTKEVFIENKVATNNNIETVLNLNRRVITGAGANGIGEEIAFNIEDNANSMIQAASIKVSLLDATSGTSQVQLNMRNATSIVKGLTLDGSRNSVALGAGATVNRNDAVILGKATNNSVHVGIGTDNPLTRFYVQGDDPAVSAVNPNAHVVLIENRNSAGATQNVNGLAISLGVNNVAVTDESNNFITFFAENAGGTSVDIGAIELTTGAGLVFSANGADYAEWLERKEITENIEAADIVGIFAGQVSKNTENAQQFRVVSTSPIVLGNRPSEDNSQETHEKIAFLGQVPVKIKGIVQAGDYIIPSGKNDGVGIAVSVQNIRASQFAQVIGMAWESSDNENVKKINVAIGLDTPQKAITRLMEDSKKQGSLIQELQKQILTLGNQNTTIKSDKVELKAQAQKIDKMQSQIETLMQMMKVGQAKEVLNAEDDK